MGATRTVSRKPLPGRVSFEASPEGESVAVYVDRPGFRRLLRTLERLAEGGEKQRFERSGRRRRKGRNGSGGAGQPIAALVFHLDEQGALDDQGTDEPEK